METNKETVSQQAEQLNSQASQLLSKVDMNKAAGWTNAYMTKVFYFGKIVAALFMFLCISTMLISLLYYAFTRTSGVKVPDFNEFRAAWQAVDKAENDNKEDMRALKETNAVRKEFDSKITKLMELCSLGKESYEKYVRKLSEMDADIRDDYIDGAIDFAKAAKKHFKDEFNGEGVLRAYDRHFEAAIEEAKADEVKTESKKKEALSVCGYALLGFILFLIIPLLIQIEEHTRK